MNGILRFLDFFCLWSESMDFNQFLTSYLPDPAWGVPDKSRS